MGYSDHSTTKRVRAGRVWIWGLRGSLSSECGTPETVKAVLVYSTEHLFQVFPLCTEAVWGYGCGFGGGVQGSVC